MATTVGFNHSTLALPIITAPLGSSWAWVSCSTIAPTFLSSLSSTVILYLDPDSTVDSVGVVHGGWCVHHHTTAGLPWGSTIATPNYLDGESNDLRDYGFRIG